MATNFKIEIDAHSNHSLFWCRNLSVVPISQYYDPRSNHPSLYYLIAYLHLCIAIESCPITRDSAEVHSLADQIRSDRLSPKSPQSFR
jgi:hypothetical protein